MNDTTDDYEKQGKDFLKRNNTKISWKFLRFGSMPWDTHDTKRNIWEFILKNDRGEYKSVYGDSLSNSCVEQPIIYSNKKADLYIALRDINDEIVFSEYIKTDYPTLLKFHRKQITVHDIFTKEHIRELSEKTIKKVVSVGSSRHKKMMGRTAPMYHIEDIKRKAENKFDESYMYGLLNNRLKKGVEEGLITMDLSAQGKTLVEPTPYDLLAILDTNYCVDFAEFFEEMGYDSSAKGIRLAQSSWDLFVKQDEALRKMFTEKELEELSEIC